MKRAAAAAPHAAAESLALAARALDAVRHAGRSADDALAPYRTHAERSAIRAIALGAMRWCLRLEALLFPLLSAPPESLPSPLRALLVVAAHQLDYSRNPRESTVSAAVDAARGMGFERAAGLVNAILRRYLRERETLLTTLQSRLAAQSAHPEWLLATFASDWPGDVTAILEANNQHPPFTLRVDRTRATAADYVAELAAAGIGAQALPWLGGAVVIDKPMPVMKLPGFAAGRVSVQDAGAQLAVLLLAPRAGERVLDACAAPGGKTGALLEYAGAALDLTAVDRSGARLEDVRDNLRRLGRSARLVAADIAVDLAADTAADVATAATAHAPLDANADNWQRVRYDAILLDAPCSATGVIRRHPDIKLLRRPSDIEAMAQLQLAILKRCFGLLAAGGRLLYTTCSVLDAENAQVIGRFLASEPRAQELPLSMAPDVPEWRPRSHGAQLLPGGQAQADGFYYACLGVRPDLP